jgi:hypothetical protein
VTLPGYGDAWNQNFTSVAFPRSGEVTLSYVINHDTEWDYDVVRVQYRDITGVWANLASYEGVAQDVTASHVIPSDALPDSVQVRFNFTSDTAWSDEDGQWDTTAGACQIDNIVISDTVGVIDSQDFESEALGDLATSDGNWTANPEPGYGNYAALFRGTRLRQDDPCEFNASAVWAFISGSTAIGCENLSNQIVTPFTNERGQAQDEAIVSPVLDLTQDVDGAPIPPDADRILLICDVYMDLPLDNLVFFTFAWQQYPDGPDNCPDTWENHQFLWYDPQAVWKHFDDEQFELPVTSPAMRVRLRAVDLCPFVCGSWGSGQCHTKAPFIDNVKIVKVRSNGPFWRVDNRYALFHDAFPADGTATGTVRMDMPRNVSGSGETPVAGDSVVVEVADDVYGMGMDDTGTDPTRAAVYLHVSSSGGQVGPGVAGDGTLYVSDNGIWTRLLCDSARGEYGPTTDYTFAGDLNDNLFVAGDQVSFYYSAANANGVTNYFSSRAGIVGSEAEARSNPDIVNCLPTGNSEILLVNYHDSESTSMYFDYMFDQLGIEADRYHGRYVEPVFAYSWIHLRATGAQLASAYKTIIWYAASDGIFLDDDWDSEEQVLVDFLAEQNLGTREANLYITGDNITRSISSYALSSKLGVGSELWDHVEQFPLRPTVTATTGSIFSHGGVPDEFYLYPGARDICRHKFDLLYNISTTAKGEMAYGPPPSATYFASVSHSFVDGNVTVKTLTDGFDITAIRDDSAGYPTDMVDHLADIMNWFGYAVTPTDAGESPTRFVNELSQNYPNPFNPSTKIQFQVKETGPVTLKVYDVAGRLVDTLVDGELVPKTGGYTVTWRGTDRSGNRVASGVYFYRLTAKGFEKTRKLVLLK